MSWTDDRVALLKKMWGEGKTAAEIAKELGGVTRNAVIGKAHRLKLSNRLSPIQQNNKKPVVAAKPAEEKAPPRKAPGAPPPSDMSREGISLALLKEKMCRWPIGDPRDADFRFCGCQSIAGLPYCGEHSKVAYQAATRNRILQAKDFEEKPAKEEVKEAATA